MARPVRRLYASAAAVLALGLAWAGIAGAGGPDGAPRVAQLAEREAKIEAKAARALMIVERRWDVYRVELRRRNLAATRAATTPVVRYVTLPPVTTSRSS